MRRGAPHPRGPGEPDRAASRPPLCPDRNVSPYWSVGTLVRDRKSTRLNSSHLVISYAVFCLKKKKQSAPGAVHFACEERAGGRSDSNGSKVISADQANVCFFFNDTATTEIYTLSLHDALPI